MDVRTLMRQAVGFNALSAAIVTGDRSVTFEQAWDRGVRVANGLRELGVPNGPPPSAKRVEPREVVYDDHQLQPLLP
jgi:hypothetical protein